MGRTYDATATRRRLLEAAQQLFSERGYEGTTTRQIAELADVDAALIARYFGNKANLYVAAVAAESNEEPGSTAESIASWAFRLTRRNGPGIVLQSLVRSDTPPEIRAASVARIEQRLLTPLTAALRDAGVAQPRLRAEVVVYSVLGLVIGRAQADSALDGAEHHELVQLVSAALSSVTTLRERA